MKYLFLLITLFLISISDSYSQCNSISVSLNEKDRKKIYDFSKDIEVELEVSFNENIYKGVTVEIYQAIGPRPVFYKKAEITNSANILFPVQFRDNSGFQYLLIKISESNSLKSICIDSIRINEGFYKADVFWKKGVEITYNVKIENKIIDPQFVKFNTNGTVVSKNSFIDSSNYLSASCKILDHGKIFECLISGDYHSNTEQLDIVIFPGAMKRLREQFGIARAYQFETLTQEQRNIIIAKFPEYEKIVNPSVKFASIAMYDTDHIVIYTMSDTSGLHYTGGECIK